MHDDQTNRNKYSGRGWIGVLASPYLTLIIVAVLIILSLIGAIVPQKGIIEEGVIRGWQQTHPVATRILEPAGSFAIFYSPIFLVSLVFLFINTLICTLQNIFKDGLFAGNSTSLRLQRVGFVTLHISILVCIMGGFISAGFRMSGHLILTEGQVLQDQYEAYPKIVEGIFRKKQHGAFQLELLNAEIEIAEKWYPVRQVSTVRLSDESAALPVSADIEFNKPLVFKKTIFTLREIGYSPQISIHSKKQRIPPLTTFIALQVWGFNEDREHYDFLPLPQVGRRLLINLFPSHSTTNGVTVKTSEELINPALLIYQESMDGSRTPTQIIEPGGCAQIGELEVQFSELRQWAAFQVVQDPGYGIVCVSFWMAIIALGLRYTPDILDWIKEAQQNGTS